MNTTQMKPGSFYTVRKISVNTVEVELKKEKKMNWFKRLLARWSREAWEVPCNSPVDIESNSPDARTSMRFTIYPASGGYVIEHHRYERHRDGEGPSLTIVNNGDSLGNAVEHILTLEALKA